MLSKLTLVITFFCAMNAIAQPPNNVWVFGNNAGLDFSTNPPQAITTSLTALEGTASVSDENGDLLFYTNGATIWDQNNNVMPNGSGILGGASSTQPALIVPLPNSCKKYYVFTTEDHTGGMTLRYSIVDLCLNGGLGDVVAGQKNVLMANNIAEKLTSVIHANGSDIWIVSHKLPSNQFVAFLITSAGVNTSPVVSSIGANYASNNFIGPIKASPSGTKIVATTSFSPVSCELFNFDKSTGLLTYDRDLMNFGVPAGAYGVEFSPDENLLYISTFWGTSRLYQFNLATNAILQLASQVGNYQYGALQRANDGKIYHAPNLMNYLGVINNPNTAGIGCNYVANGFALAPGTTCASGFPAFNPWSFSGLQPISDLIADSNVVLCVGEEYDVEINLDCNGTVLWNTGSTSPSQTFTTPGTYVVNVNNGCNIISDSIVVSQNNSAVTISLPPDTLSCSLPAGGYVINPIVQGTPTGDETYLWSTGETTASIQVTLPGVYWLEASAGCDVFRDTMEVSINNLPVILLPDTLESCLDDFPVTLVPDLSNYNSILWSDGTSDVQATATIPGSYTITAFNDCGSDSASVVVTSITAPSVTLPSTIDSCVNAGDFVLLAPEFSGVDNQLWNTGSVTSGFSVTSSGNYWVAAFNECGSDTAFCDVTLNFFPELFLPPVLDTCFDLAVGFSYTVQGTPGNYQWNTGSTDATEWISSEGLYTCTLTNACGSVTQTMQVNRVAEVSLLVPDDSVLFCSRELDVSDLQIETNYDMDLFYNNELVSGDHLLHSGWYTIYAYNVCGSVTDSIYVEMQEEQYFYVPNSFTPNSDGKNELFYYSGANSYIQEVIIFNRWGQQIYVEKGGFSGWDGTYRGKLCPDGMYQVQIVYADCFGILKQFNGHVNLLK